MNIVTWSWEVLTQAYLYKDDQRLNQHLQSGMVPFVDGLQNRFSLKILKSSREKTCVIEVFFLKNAGIRQTLMPHH